MCSGSKSKSREFDVAQMSRLWLKYKKGAKKERQFRHVVEALATDRVADYDPNLFWVINELYSYPHLGMNTLKTKKDEDFMATDLNF